jgi:hypothetical protein
MGPATTLTSRDIKVALPFDQTTARAMASLREKVRQQIPPFAAATIARPVIALWDDLPCALGVLPRGDSGRDSTDTQRGGRFSMARHALSGKSSLRMLVSARQSVNFSSQP